MRKIIVSEFVSLDTVMQAPGGAEEDTEGGFTHGGWTGPFWHDDIGTLCWLLGTSVRKAGRVLRTDMPRSQHRD